MRGTKLHGLLGCTTMQLCQRHLAYTLYQPSPVILGIGEQMAVIAEQENLYHLQRVTEGTAE